MFNTNNTAAAIEEFIANGGKITKCPTRTVVSKADREFRRLGFSPDAARICRLNMREYRGA